MSKNEITYAQAIEELEAIVKRMENEDIEVDELSETVKRAGILIRICREKLKVTEQEVNNLLTEITKAENSENSSDDDVKDDEEK